MVKATQNYIINTECIELRSTKVSAIYINEHYEWIIWMHILYYAFAVAALV